MTSGKICLIEQYSIDF